MCDVKILSSSKVKTRKLHGCTWCGQSIPIGSLVQSDSGLMDGVMQSQWWHDECQKAFEKTEWGDPYEMCWSFGEFGRGEVAG